MSKLIPSSSPLPYDGAMKHEIKNGMVQVPLEDYLAMLSLIRKLAGIERGTE